MQTGRPCLDQCHRLLTRLAARCVPVDMHARATRLRALALLMISRAWAGAMGQPSPLAAFALALMLELGKRLLQLPGIQAGGSALIEGMLLGLVALTFQLASENPDFRSGSPGGPGLKQAQYAPFVWQTRCGVRPRHAAGAALKSALPVIASRFRPYAACPHAIT